MNLWLPTFSLWWREMIRFYRQRARVVGVIVSPFLFWLLLGAGFGSSLRTGTSTAPQDYLAYFFPGTLIMIVLFTSIFTMMSVIEDRKEGFLLAVMVAPIHRSAVVLGKVMGGTSLAAIQGLIFLVLAPVIGIRFGLIQFLEIAGITFLISFALTAIGFAVAWVMDSTQAFHAVVNLFLIPLWMLSGALFSVENAHGWLQWLMRANPLTYGLAALRSVLFPSAPASALGLSGSIFVLAIFSLLVFLISFALVNRRRTLPSA